jgi:hypothetical protein
MLMDLFGCEVSVQVFRGIAVFVYLIIPGRDGLSIILAVVILLD